MLIQIHQKTAQFGEGSTSTSSHMNQAAEQENEDQNIHVTEPEPQVVILAHEESLAKVVPPKPLISLVCTRIRKNT